ncbi:uncharacterized protein LOC125038387 [Penaeus chinensis]|uniref:uncharacterized protein LOC125038387 n=1 Tax=Penaeus chinensis TaxID=139456 RepID=UPI001FB5BE93|nr:uncharacterized protein LOC125038387 [Penaeus chinensis]
MGMGIILDDNLKKGVLSVIRRSDRIIWLRVDLGREIVNIVSAYAPQTGCNAEEKDELDDELKKIPTSEKLWIGGDFNGNDNIGKEEYIGKHGIDYILCRTNEKANIRDCKVILGESVTSQHRPLICTLSGKKLELKKLAGISRTKWWKLADRNAQNEFASAAMVRLTLRESEGSQNWETVTEDLRQLGEELLGRTSGKSKTDKETWWWNEEVQQHIKIKKETKKILDQENNVENREAYKIAKKAAKRSVARVEAKAYQRLYDDMETLDGQNRALRIAKQRDKNSKDIYQTKLIKDEEGNVLVEDAMILNRWRAYFSKLPNEINPRMKRQEPQRSVEEIPEIALEEVENAPKKMKNGKAVGPDNIPVEVWKCLGKTGVEYLTREFNSIINIERLPEQWWRSTNIPIFKNKGDILASSLCVIA